MYIHCWLWRAMKRDTPERPHCWLWKGYGYTCTLKLLALERVKPCTFILLVVERDTPCMSIVHSAGGGKGITLQVHTASGCGWMMGYILLLVLYSLYVAKSNVDARTPWKLLTRHRHLCQTGTIFQHRGQSGALVTDLSELPSYGLLHKPPFPRIETSPVYCIWVRFFMPVILSFSLL